MTTKTNHLRPRKLLDSSVETSSGIPLNPSRRSRAGPTLLSESRLSRRFVGMTWSAVRASGYTDHEGTPLGKIPSRWLPTFRAAKKYPRPISLVGGLRATTIGELGFFRHNKGPHEATLTLTIDAGGFMLDASRPRATDCLRALPTMPAGTANCTLKS